MNQEFAFYEIIVPFWNINFGNFLLFQVIIYAKLNLIVVLNHVRMNSSYAFFQFQKTIFLEQ